MSVLQHSDGDVSNDDPLDHESSVGEQQSTYLLTYTVEGRKNVMSVPESGVTIGNGDTLADNAQRNLCLIEGCNENDIEVLSVAERKDGNTKRHGI